MPRARCTSISPAVRSEGTPVGFNVPTRWKPEGIMAEEHVDHPWYHNPGETEEQWEAKRRRARESGQSWRDVAGNTTR